MFRFWSGRHAAKTRRPVLLRPEMTALEVREMPATIVSFLNATPQLLNPPNNKYVTVTVSGGVLETNPKDSPNGEFRVIDEYRRIQPKGKLVLNKVASNAYLFTFTVQLQASRANEYINGRHYYILAEVSDRDNSSGKYVPILVPHNKLPVSQTTLNGPVQKLHSTPPRKKG